MFSMDGGIYRTLSFLYRCMMLNLLFIVSSIFIVTIPPATAGLFAVTRKFIGGDEPPIFRTFWSAFRENLKQSYVVGIVFLLVGLIVWVDLRVFAVKHWAFGGAAALVLMFIALFAASTLMHIFPLMVHINQTTRHLFTNAIRLNFLKPYLSLLILAASIAWFFVAARFTILFVILFFSIWAYLVYWAVNMKFKAILALQEPADELPAED